MPHRPATNLFLWKVTDGTYLSGLSDFRALFSTGILKIQILDINSDLVQATRRHKSGEPSQPSQLRSDLSMLPGADFTDAKTWDQVSRFLIIAYTDKVIHVKTGDVFMVILGTIKITPRPAIPHDVHRADDVLVKESHSKPTLAMDQAAVLAVENQADGSNVS
ncbi:hypothetical protein SCP_1104270 [Sparassis crispa]|uniref:Uncharacterized protein n=1 Tax=Sparassis crispa TaxID=139825 RepID=A0A401H025_9APHY|nr:hypothetical protein SCP_1104270 [Sparassis crispa]GBE87750.1 hypothetical protein SCP_1104270 [Sparassis crispa]